MAHPLRPSLAAPFTGAAAESVLSPDGARISFLTLGSGPATKVTWTMQGSNLYVMKVMSIFVNMDRVMGKHFQSGLNHLKKAAENRP